MLTTHQRLLCLASLLLSLGTGDRVAAASVPEDGCPRGSYTPACVPECPANRDAFCKGDPPAGCTADDFTGSDCPADLTCAPLIQIKCYFGTGETVPGGGLP